MLVEFIGSTGAGKTTVLRSVEGVLAERMPCRISSELITGLVGLQRTTNVTVQNLVQETVSFPSFLASLYRYRAFVVSTLRLLARGFRPGVVAINNVRSLERKLGTYALLRWIERDEIILIDEGPLLAAHMLVPGARRLTADDIESFSKTLPLPDMIVYVRVPVAVVVARTLRRVDPPREARSRSHSDLAQYAEDAIEIFERVVASLNGRVPILIVDNPDTQWSSPRALAENIATCICNEKLKACCSDSGTLIGGTTYDLGLYSSTPHNSPRIH
jgi:thymidylate kinase